MTAAAPANELYRKRLGWTLADLGLVERPPTDAALADEIRSLQRTLGLQAVDGVCGPATLSAALAARQARLVTTDWPTAEGRLVAAGLIAVCETKRLWLRNIVDLPPRTATDHERCRSTIDQLIRTPWGIDWSWEDPYLANGDYEWCGTFAALGWGAAGLKLAIRRSFFPSTYRLDRWGRYKSLGFEATPTPNQRPTTGPHRMMIELDEHAVPSMARFPDGSPPRAGDIVTVGGVATGPGKHIAVAEEFDAATGSFTTLEGNGSGQGPKGNHQHGVVRARRLIGLPAGAVNTFYFVRRVIRPSVLDLV